MIEERPYLKLSACTKISPVVTITPAGKKRAQLKNSFGLPAGVAPQRQPGGPASWGQADGGDLGQDLVETHAEFGLAPGLGVLATLTAAITPASKR